MKPCGVGSSKCMGSVCDLKRHNLGWIAPYNGKPVLITDSSGDVYRGSMQHVVSGVMAEVSYLELSGGQRACMVLPGKARICDVDSQV
eukprot:CAMPEP_0116021604 /NCGR_PEP_ID=MMETSP0321-20121206/10491_1 /TAXON_ID=163516 /ORGANISM="Leptocylindrus danicus var. danicus, Strain B650" /LENGTH=87 /DNA_ID=CAMNT_0003492517 /DNA_START=513 /DNA_END=776 /DNA_ORIENTATION=-